MKLTLESSFTVSLAWEAHTRAEQQRRWQTQPGKAKQVYLNSLALYAVNMYLQCQGFATDLATSDSNQPVLQTLLDIADLDIKNCGKLECRPVLPDAEFCHIPVNVWHGRIAYVAVQLNQSLREATLLGFTDSVETEEFPLSQLKPLEALPAHLNQIEQANLLAPLVNLNQWLNHVFETGWETLDTLFDLSSPDLAFNFRSSPLLEDNALEKTTSIVVRGKRLNLNFLEQVVLLVALRPSATPEIKISVELHPLSGQGYLPQDLQLMVLDETGEPVVQAQAGNTENIQVEFRGTSSERFGVEVVLGDTRLSQAFLI